MNTFRFPIRAFIILLALFCLNACKDKEEVLPPSPTTGITPDSTKVYVIPKAYPDQTGVLKEGKLFGEPIKYREINGQAVFQGDMILTPEQLAGEEAPVGGQKARISGAGRTNKLKRWQNYTVPYTVDPALPNPARVTAAINHWQANSPLQFVPRTNQSDYITFKPGAGCSSEVGRTGSQQIINLAPDCGTTGAIIHEIGHAVGLFHEQSRSDRDKSITVHYNNIIKDDWDEYDRYVDRNRKGFDFRPFDFNSIMLYPPFNTSAIDQQKPTMTIKGSNGATWTAQTTQLSANDIGTVVSMYANLYVVKGGKMYAVALSEGWGTELSYGWDGFNAKIMAEDQDDRYLWAIHGQTLWRVDRLTGKYKDFGDGWNGAVGITGIPGGTTRWAIKGKNLYAINPEGARKDVDDFDWSNSKAIYAHKDFLFIVDGNGTLWKSDMNTGKWHDLGGGWGGTKAITASRASDNNNIYMITGTTLWQVNINTGAYTKIGPSHWSGVEGMVGYQGNLYVMADGTLWKVSENGNRQSIIGGWSGIQSMGIIRNPGLN